MRYPKVIRDTIEREPVEMDGRMVPVDLDEDVQPSLIALSVLSDAAAIL